MNTTTTPLARGPLLDAHRRAKATLGMQDGWEVALRYPADLSRGEGNSIVDLSHWTAWELGGKATTAALLAEFGADVPLRRIHVGEQATACRLTPSRVLVFGPLRTAVPSAIDVTGGWAGVALLGPEAEFILSKVTAVDVREQTLPVLGCCQGPIFGVNTLFCRYADRFELHVCPDSLEFLWDVLLDAGAEFRLQPAGLEYYQSALQAAQQTR